MNTLLALFILQNCIN